MFEGFECLDLPRPMKGCFRVRPGDFDPEQLAAASLECCYLAECFMTTLISIDSNLDHAQYFAPTPFLDEPLRPSK